MGCPFVILMKKPRGRKRIVNSKDELLPARPVALFHEKMD